VISRDWSAAGSSPEQRHAAEIGEFQLQARQKSVIGWQRLAPQSGDFRPATAALSLLFVDISLQRSAKAEKCK
jgi:hypothetical protein